MSNTNPVPSLTLFSAGDDEWTLQIEPWGNIHTLAAADRVRVESTDVSTGNVEVGHVPGGLIVWFNADPHPVLTNTAGAVLQL